MSEPVPTAKTQAAERKTPFVILLWLLVYNFASLGGWAYVLFLLVQSLVQTNGDFTRSYAAVGDVVAVVQTGAVFEIAHALVGFVKTPVFTTAVQVASRLLLIFVTQHFEVPLIRENGAFTTMVLAWSITEVVRYSYYGLNLLGSQPGALVWARYTFFYVLYPLGAGSEFWLVLKASDLAKEQYGIGAQALAMIIIYTYPIGFWVMYSHMIKQRRKYLGAGKKDAKAPETKKTQ
ncbi:hypothetical protein HK105_200273 [Polyrhizophydium stewartii]|uniref:Very-long-chain (3R)-3-hydroxyacyl-CoA dehydratase n=1 Tax=Polyrhizophydium stewartii TaxID=2732419 RepID=A0ABR4NL58_9FUNG